MDAIGSDARAGTGRAEIVGHGRADKQARGENRRVAVAFTPARKS